jgi:uncharacterized protein (UPF0332 family)
VRAAKDLESAGRELGFNPDLAASCAYYAAFYGLTALFALEGRTFRKHSGIRDAMHLELVRPGKLQVEAGRCYDELMDLRAIGSYGGAAHVTPEEAANALSKARSFLAAISALHPDDLSAPSSHS